MSKKFGAQAAHMLFGKIDDMLERVSFGIEKAREYLFAQQHEDGYWCGELEADTTLESDYIPFTRCLAPAIRAACSAPCPRLFVIKMPTGAGPFIPAVLRISALQ